MTLTPGPRHFTRVIRVKRLDYKWWLDCEQKLFMGWLIRDFGIYSRDKGWWIYIRFTTIEQANEIDGMPYVERTHHGYKRLGFKSSLRLCWHLLGSKKG